MPNAKVLQAGVIVDYKGITVEEDTALRRECRESGIDYAVVKNTLLRFAFNNTGLSELDGLLNGTTSLALCDSDVVSPARVMSNYAKRASPWIWPPSSPWLPFPLCLCCRPSSWVPCWPPSPAWLWS